MVSKIKKLQNTNIIRIINSKHVRIYDIILPLNVDKLFWKHYLLVLVLLNTNYTKLISYNIFNHIIHKKV